MFSVTQLCIELDLKENIISLVRWHCSSLQRTQLQPTTRPAGLFDFITILMIININWWIVNCVFHTIYRGMKHCSSSVSVPLYCIVDSMERQRENLNSILLPSSLLASLSKPIGWESQRSLHSDLLIQWVLRRLGEKTRGACNWDSPKLCQTVGYPF